MGTGTDCTKRTWTWIASVFAALAAGCSAPAHANTGDAEASAIYAIEIAPSGLQPQTVTVFAGSRLAIQNDDAIAHEIASSSASGASVCPEFDVGSIAPGARVTVVVPDRAVTCGIVDRNRPGDSRFAGMVAVASSATATHSR